MYYYYDEAAGESTWEKPEYRPPPMGPPPLAPPPPPAPPPPTASGEPPTGHAGQGDSVQGHDGIALEHVPHAPQGQVEDSSMPAGKDEDSSKHEHPPHRPPEAVVLKPFDCGLECVGTCPAVCGDRMRVDAEGCDDGNTVDGDGCSATCTLESTFSPATGMLLARYQCVEVPWQAVWDEEFGKYYYWNPKTGESSWTKPARQTFGGTGTYA